MANLPFLFVSDLDDTLVGSLPEDREALRVLNAVLAEPEVTVIYATGRSPASALTLIAEAELLIPDALVTSVGTAIYYSEDPDRPDHRWWELLKDGWQTEAIEAVAGLFPELWPQPSAEQGPFKRSYFLDPAHAYRIAELEAQLLKAQLRTRVVYSSFRDLDILPAKGNKGSAVRYLQERWNFDSRNTVVCGDSGNDQSLFETGNLGIAVGNARSELVAWMTGQPKLPIYAAKGRCAEGIAEGLRHWQLI
ncbi:sucrose-phosphate phosphatase [Gloeobacter violaceus]|uniref:sucrose-phosphate phosphatase n=1 Tax=Gloeobacter violaceus (strain ATCC 29082 / PCC 7421) TaxID=251221 RepID=Q7NEP0_GLOVI|nr:sucrose-phosphate phosphatase [Gloeobacter violaceus]BAC91780.1 gll3839 [Gloeobacter violaceus PCC 7421]